MKLGQLFGIIIGSTMAVNATAQTTMKALQISTTETDKWHVYPASVVTDDQNPQRLKFKSDDINVTFRRFGTCFNELDWYALQLLPQAEQDKFFHDFFSPDGDLRFSLGRIPMGASDYAGQSNFYTELYHEREEGIGIWDAWYSPDEMPRGEKDLDMSHFNLERDRKAIIPFIKKAQAENPELTFWCSPWSPPMWMKKSEHYSNRAGYGNGLDVTYPRYTTQFKMEDDILKAHAMYFSKFITEYGKEGIPITGCCYQNEAYTVNFYPNTSWSADDAGRFNADYLIPYLNEHNLGVKVWLGTLNTADVNNIETILNTVSTADGYKGKHLYEMVAGAGFQWEGRDAIGTIRKDYPNIEMIQTESECGGGTFDWPAGVHTFELIHHYLNNGCVDYTNWNSILGGNGRGPFMNWHQNAIAHINERLPRANGTCTMTYTPEYYAYKHYSHFLCEGTKILNKSVKKDLLLVAQRPDGMYVAVVGNEAAQERSLKLDIDGNCINVTVPARSMNTFVIGTETEINDLSAKEGLKDSETEYPASNTNSVFIDSNQKYYIYNVKEGKYLNAGGRFGTRPVLDEVGCEYTLEYSDAGDNYYLKTPYGANTYLGWGDVAFDGATIENRYWMDNTSSKEALTFYPTTEDNVYAIGIYGYYLTFKPSLACGSLSTGELGWGDVVKAGDNVQEMDGVLWKLVTREERLAEARKATEAEPADVTFALLHNPDFNRLHDGNDAWSEAPATPGMTADPYREYVGEFFNKGAMTSQLDFTRLQAGVYEFTINGFYRWESSSSAASTTDTNTSVSIFAKGDNDEAKKAYLPVLAAGANEGKMNRGDESQVADKAGWYVPNNGASAVYYFNKGNYPATTVSAVVKDGNLSLGFENTMTLTNDWICFDNMRIKYYPYASDVTMNTDYLEKLNNCINEARQLHDGTSNPAGKDALQTAINDAQKVYNDQPSWAVSQQAIFVLQDAMEAFRNAQASSSVSDAINEHRGDASFLLPERITAWNVAGTNIVRNEVTGENWDGLNNSAVGLVKVVGGSVSTSLNAMPAGTYRMVAAVRGTRGNRATASVNGMAGAPVTLPGWGISEMAEGTPCINVQGVQMPSNAQKMGYSNGQFTHGWMWASAEGTLAEPGTLNLSIALGSNECQVSNVFLYYLGDDVVRYTEGEELHNNGKTVMADIALSNPNTIIATDMVLTTAANSMGYNNNLVDGNISSLVLFDGYDYEPITGTAQSAVLYRTIAADSWVTLSLPFSCATPAGADVAELSSLIAVGDNTYTLGFTQNVPTMVGGKAYLYKGSSALSSFEASDAQLSLFVPTSVHDKNNSAVAVITPSYKNGRVSMGDYFISANTLYRCASETVSLKPFRASISLSATDSDARLSTFVVNEETGICAASSSGKGSANIYDLTGRRIEQPRQGIYIINHKKTFIR